MISAWDVYWVMQLDSIGGFFGFTAVGLLVSAGMAVFVGGLACDFGDFGAKNEAGWERVKRGAMRAALAGLASAAFATFIPSTKTAATMIVLPAIVNNEALHKEAGELYGLAKQALKDAVAPEKTE